MKKLLALLLTVCMLASVTAVFAETATSEDTPLVVAIATLSQKFSPFFADTGYDQEVVDHTQLNMMTTDRVGGIIYKGIEGETISYNGNDYTYYGPGDLSVNYDETADITTYGFKMRDDLKFSDGEPVTIDDVIFTYYVYLDPAYNGSTTLSSYDIVGLKAYRTQIPEANVEEVSAIADAVKAAFAANGADYKVAEGDTFTQEVFDSYAAAVTALWKEDLQGIVDYVYAQYGIYLPRTSQEQGGTSPSRGGCGTLVPNGQEQPGDLVCWGSHIGIYIGNGQVIHASSPGVGTVIYPLSYRSGYWFRRVL